MIRVLFLALALTACSPTGRDPQANESAALDMIRMGYVQWVAACAWQHGRNHSLLATAIRRCLADDGVLAFNVWAAKPSVIAPRLGFPPGEFRLVGRHPLPGTDRIVTHHCTSSYDEFRQHFTEHHVIREVDDRGTVRRSLTLPLVRAWTTPRELDNLVRFCGFDVEALFGDFDCTPFNARSTEMIWILRKAAANQP